MRLEPAVAVIAVDVTLGIVVDAVIADFARVTRQPFLTKGIVTIDQAISVVVDIVKTYLNLQAGRPVVTKQIVAIDLPMKVIVDPIVAILIQIADRVTLPASRITTIDYVEKASAKTCPPKRLSASAWRSTRKATQSMRSKASRKSSTTTRSTLSGYVPQCDRRRC